MGSKIRPTVLEIMFIIFMSILALWVAYYGLSAYRSNVAIRKAFAPILTESVTEKSVGKETLDSAVDASADTVTFKVLSKAADTSQAHEYYYVTIEGADTKKQVIAVSNDVYDSLAVGDSLVVPLGKNDTLLFDFATKATSEYSA